MSGATATATAPDYKTGDAKGAKLSAVLAPQPVNNGKAEAI